MQFYFDQQTKRIKIQILPWDIFKGRQQEDEDQFYFDQQTKRIKIQILPWDIFKGRQQEDEDNLVDVHSVAWSFP